MGDCLSHTSPTVSVISVPCAHLRTNSQRNSHFVSEEGVGRRFASHARACHANGYETDPWVSAATTLTVTSTPGECCSSTRRSPSTLSLLSSPPVEEVVVAAAVVAAAVVVGCVCSYYVSSCVLHMLHTLHACAPPTSRIVRVWSPSMHSVGQLTVITAVAPISVATTASAQSADSGS